MSFQKLLCRDGEVYTDANALAVKVQTLTTDM